MAVILGFAGSGKSHTLALLLGKKLLSKHVSTSCVKTPIRTIGRRRFKKDASSKGYSEISPEKYSQMVMKSGKDALHSTSCDMTERDVQKKDIKDEVTDQLSKLIKGVEDGLIDALNMTDFVNSLVDELVIEMVDSGGQPQFLEILPRFIGCFGLTVLVTDLSKRLDQCSTSYFYGEDGEPVGIGKLSDLTNEQLLYQFLQMVFFLSCPHTH